MVIDFHTHIFPDKIAGATINALSSGANIPPHSDGTLNGLVNQMEKAGVNLSVNLPVLTKSKQFDSIFEFGKNINNSREIPVLSFAGIHPDEEDLEEKLNRVKGEGFKGIKIHPDYQGTFFDDEKYVRILSLAKSLDLITVTHAGLDGAFVGQEIKCTPKRVLTLLDKIGGYEKLVLAHMGGNELFSEVLDNLAGERVYFDTSYVLPFLSEKMIYNIIEKQGEDRILFATDSPWQNQKEMIKILKGYNFGKEAEDKIFYKNASHLLNLE